jgi:hypothetical protein
VRSLIRDDGLSQVAVAELLRRHKSWVCRRLALLERLCTEAGQDLEVGLLPRGPVPRCGQPRVGN